MMCECCYRSAALSVLGYSEQVSAHEKRGCICAKNTESDARARAGQWWDEYRKVDGREFNEGMLAIYGAGHASASSAPATKEER